MSLFIPLIAVLAALGARLVIERSRYIQERAKFLPTLPLGL